MTKFTTHSNYRAIHKSIQDCVNIRLRISPINKQLLAEGLEGEVVSDALDAAIAELYHAEMYLGEVLSGLVVKEATERFISDCDEENESDVEPNNQTI